MLALLNKEIASFFSTLTGYVVIVVYLTANSLALFIFRGDLNLLDSGYANLDPLFYLAPMFFLFLVPAITMKLFAEERRNGTLEVLLTLPLGRMQVILAKYLAALILVVFSLVPTGIYYLTVYLLGSPPGNLDHGGILGSYLGLLFLAGVYAAAGLFISAVSRNQAVSFLVTVLACFILSTGIERLTSMDLLGRWGYFILKLGIIEHYRSISRGVVDTRDVIYFMSVIAMFLILTGFVLSDRKSWGPARILVLLAGILIVNILFSLAFHRFDLTSEKRYSLSPVTREVLRGLKDEVKVKVYLDGELPAGFIRLKTAIRETLDEFRSYAGQNIRYEFIDPAGDPDPAVQRSLFSELVQKGLRPTNVQVVQKDGSTMQKILFPGVMISCRGVEVPVNLLKNNMGAPGEVNLHQSIQSLEYEFVIMLRNLSSDTIEKVAFLEGHGEMSEIETGDIMRELARFYQVDRGKVQGRPGSLDNYKAVIIAGPTEAFPEEDKFVIDQYIMKGGKVLWLIDPVRVSMDSLVMGSTLALYRSLNLEDQLFRYGVRLNPNLVQDIQCHVIPVNKAPAGAKPSFQLSPWYYYPVVSPGDEHPVTRGLNMIWIRFASVIDTVGLDPGIKKTILLSTSPYTRVVPVPKEISLLETELLPEESLFSKANRPLAVLLEGNFTSVFANRPLPGLNAGETSRFKEFSQPARMIVISDADIIRNEVLESQRGPVPGPLGFDRFTGQTFGNREFILNCVNYLTRSPDLMQLRGREFRMRLLDRRRVRENADFWKWFNTAVPSALVIVSGLIVWIVRRQRYEGTSPLKK